MVLKIYTTKKNYHLWYKISIIIWVILGIIIGIIGFVRNNIYMGYCGIVVITIALIYSILVHFSEKRRSRKLEEIYNNFNISSSASYEST